MCDTLTLNGSVMVKRVEPIVLSYHLHTTTNEWKDGYKKLSCRRQWTQTKRELLDEIGTTV